jgi:hypothetical protein
VRIENEQSVAQVKEQVEEDSNMYGMDICGRFVGVRIGHIIYMIVGSLAEFFSVVDVATQK